jgi:hypothetical protein
MGAYTIKARTFARMRLYIYTNRKIAFYAGHFDKHAKKIVQGKINLMTCIFKLFNYRFYVGFYRLREAKRLYLLRQRLHQWANVIAAMLNWDLAKHFYYHHFGRSHFMAWFTYAHDIVLDRRHELMATERQQGLFKMLGEAEGLARELVQVETVVKKRRKEEEDYKIKMEIEHKKAMEKLRAQKAKENEVNFFCIIFRYSRHFNIRMHS